MAISEPVAGAPAVVAAGPDAAGATRAGRSTGLEGTVGPLALVTISTQRLSAMRARGRKVAGAPWS